MASEKRKSNTGLVLQPGESQRPDGRFRYRYTDHDGNRHDIYSWRLRPQDPVPEGKKDGPSLRELEETVKKNLSDGLRPWEGKTVAQGIEEYLENRKPELAPATWQAYENALKLVAGSRIANVKITDVKSDEIENFYLDLLRNRGLKFSSIGTVEAILVPALDRAVRSRIICYNPAEGILSDLKKRNRDIGQPKERHALEQSAIDDFLEFVRTDPIYQKYYDVFYLLAWTGTRISELLSLTWFDIDFKSETIFIRRTFTTIKDNSGVFHTIVKKPKSKAGIREIPMLQDVKVILSELKKDSPFVFLPTSQIPTITTDNVAPFVFRNLDGSIISRKTIESSMAFACKKFNQTRSESDKIVGLSPHVLRHSFCCWLIENLEAESTADALKVVQSIMGHSSANVTLDIYSELRQSNKARVFRTLREKAAR